MQTARQTDPVARSAPHPQLAHAIRALAMDAVEQAASGHPGMPLGFADVATVLWSEFLRFDASQPDWPDRDRLILSAGHGSMLLYAVAYLTGYAALPVAELQRFRQLHSRTPGHPEHDVAIGVETTTGPLGQGLANAVGMALAEAMLRTEFGEALVDHRTWVIASDGDMMEGISHEAVSLAGHLRLRRLCVLYDDNGISIDGPTSLSFSDDTAARFRACGWFVEQVDGHDSAAIRAALRAVLQADRPSLICCRTTIGYGAPTKANSAAAHGAPLGAAEIAGVRRQLGWDHPPFVVPDDVLASWRAVGRRGQSARLTWEARLAASPQGEALRARLAGTMPAGIGPALDTLCAQFADKKPQQATRQASGAVLQTLLPLWPALVGGSADLTPSNNTQVKDSGVIAAGTYTGRYVHFGVREHAMVAALNGLSLHGGFVPYAGTFLQFADYCRPAIRLAALMRQRIILVMTHDSIGLGEDGPTHQPVEHLASLRAMPNLRVFRPADGIETAECWALAVQRTDGPSLLALSRQALPTVRSATAQHSCATGGYVLAEADGDRRLTLLATGSEVAIALAARAHLQRAGIATAVVSLPCIELFLEQSAPYQDGVLGSGPRIAIEAGVALGWQRLLRAGDRFLGVTTFGASAPQAALYEHFGLSAKAIVATAGQMGIT